MTDSSVRGGDVRSAARGGATRPAVTSTGPAAGDAEGRAARAGTVLIDLPAAA